MELLLDQGDKDQIDAWLDQVLLENDDGPMTINFHLEPGYSLENSISIHDSLYERGLIRRGR